MKTKSINSLALALVVTMASTGCKHMPESVTAIPSWRGPNIAQTGPGNTISSGEQPIPLPTNWTPETMSEDRNALAADTVHFAYDSAVMRDREQANLKSVASMLQSDPSAKLLVEGNCDERGTEEYNRSLGERRALSSREAVSRLDIDPMRITTISYGKDKPVDPGHDETAWTKNRRDDFVLLHPKVEIESNTLSYDP